MQRTVFLLAVALTGCTGSAAVSGDKRLPMRNVVLYRSGVAYFERAGRFEGQTLQFRVKQSEVGDFLASLTAVEKTPGGVRSVSFEVPETPPPAPVPMPRDEGGFSPRGPVEPVSRPDACTTVGQPPAFAPGFVAFRF